MQDDLVREFLWLSALKNLRVARAAGDLVEKARALGFYWARDTGADVEHKVLRELLDSDRLAGEVEAWFSSVQQEDIERKQDEVLAGLDSKAGRALARADLLTNCLAYGLEPRWYGCLEPAEVRALESLSRRTGAGDPVDVAGEDLVERCEAELREHLSPESALVLTRRPPGFVIGTVAQETEEPLYEWPLAEHEFIVLSDTVPSLSWVTTVARMLRRRCIINRDHISVEHTRHRLFRRICAESRHKAGDAGVPFTGIQKAAVSNIAALEELEGSQEEGAWMDAHLFLVALHETGHRVHVAAAHRGAPGIVFFENQDRGFLEALFNTRIGTEFVADAFIFDVLNSLEDAKEAELFRRAWLASRLEFYVIAPDADAANYLSVHCLLQRDPFEEFVGTMRDIRQRGLAGSEQLMRVLNARREKAVHSRLREHGHDTAFLRY